MRSYTVDGIRKGILGWEVLQRKEMRTAYYNRPKTQQQRLKHSGETSGKAGELGYENDPPIMRINNDICSWPFSFPNQINHHRSPKPKSFPLFTFPFISSTSTSFVLSHSFANCAIWGAGFKRHLLSNTETERAKKGQLRIYHTRAHTHMIISVQILALSLCSCRSQKGMHKNNRWILIGWYYSLVLKEREQKTNTQKGKANINTSK